MEEEESLHHSQQTKDVKIIFHRFMPRLLMKTFRFLFFCIKKQAVMNSPHTIMVSKTK